GTALPRQEPGPDEALQDRGKPISAEPFRGNGLLASSAHILTAKHDGEQPDGVAGQACTRMGAVIGVNGSGDVLWATQVDGHGWGVRWLRQGAPGRTRARASLWQAKGLAKRA